MKLGHLPREHRTKDKVAGGGPPSKQDYLEMFYLTGRLSSGKEGNNREQLQLWKK